MIFPISHERMSARRWPIVTTIFFLTCILVQLILTFGPNHHARERDTDADERAIEYFSQHPYLDVKPNDVVGLEPATVKPLQEATHAILQPPDPEMRDAEQKEFDGLLRATKTPGADAADPFKRFGYTPAAPTVMGLFTYAFVHAGWLHLAGNMWFLIFCGMTLEDRWGRVVFPIFYLVVGAVAAFAHGLFHPHDSAPLVGASGAIAGCMGAFAVALGRTRVRFALLITLRPRVFTAPAYVVLPIWAVFEALWGWIFPSDGTSHVAHVAGFVFGVGAALVLHATGVDRKLDDSIDKSVKLGDDPRIDEARLLIQRGDAQMALAMLEGLAAEKSTSPHVQDAIAEAAKVLGDDARAQKAEQRAARLREFR